MATKNSSAKASPDIKMAVSARLDAANFHRAEAICKAKNMTIAEFTRMAVEHEIDRVAGALPNKEPTLSDIDKRLDALSKQLETSYSLARESDKSVQFMRRMLDSVCAALGLKAIKG